MAVCLIATLDTKGIEIAFVRDLLRTWGTECLIIDAGCRGEPVVQADITREDVFLAAGASLNEHRERGERGAAITVAARGVAVVIERLHAEGRVEGVLAIGGSAGTTIGTAAMRQLPLGIPKVMVSTLASGQTRPYVGVKDILMLNAVVDVAGLNQISRIVLGEAAGAMAGMLRFRPPVFTDARPLVAATMFGVTTPCVEHARNILEAAGYQVLVFHATGTGGQAMESLIKDGVIAGVLDMTTTELADELVGGTLTAGPDRLTAAGLRGVPQVISVGALDMVNFGPPETVPTQFQSRLFYRHNETVTLMRTTVAENHQLGVEIGRKAAAATGPTTIIFPGGGVSAIDAPGQPFEDLAARAALLTGLRSTHGHVPLIERVEHINDPKFAEQAAQALLALMGTA